MCCASVADETFVILFLILLIKCRGSHQAPGRPSATTAAQVVQVIRVVASRRDIK